MKLFEKHDLRLLIFDFKREILVQFRSELF